MTGKEQNISCLRQYLVARKVAPWIVGLGNALIDPEMRRRLDLIGGIAGSWRTDYSECTYSSPQLVDEKLVDLSTIQKVRDFYEKQL